MVTSEQHRKIRIFTKNLHLALDMLGAPKKGRQAYLANIMEITQNGVRKWLEGEGMPNTSRLSILADKLGVSVEWFFEDQTKDKPRPISPDRKAYVDKLISMPDEEFKPVKAIIDLIDGISTKRIDPLSTKKKPL